MQDCNICVEKYNKTIRKEIICNKCNFSCCKQCFKKYILDNSHYFSCMSCKKEFNRKDLYQIVGTAFINKEYITALKDIIYDIEQKYFIDTQPIVANEINRDKVEQLKKQNYNEILRLINIYNCKQNFIDTNFMNINNEPNINKFIGLDANISRNRVLNNICKIINTLSDKYCLQSDNFKYKLKELFIGVPKEEFETIKTIKRNIIQIEKLTRLIGEYNMNAHELKVISRNINNIKYIKCPYDNCLASINIDEKITYNDDNKYQEEKTEEVIIDNIDNIDNIENIENKFYKCTINYEHIICKKCHESVELIHEHECNKNIIKSIKTMNRTSKHCPSCLTLIQKSEGCNQMFCTNCKTIFDWVSLKVDTGGRHNPMYLEWIRENPKNKEMVNKNVNIIEENNHNDCNRLIQIETFVNIREILLHNLNNKIITIKKMVPTSIIESRDHDNIKTVKIIESFVRDVVHTREYCRTFYTYEVHSYNINTSKRMRIKYMYNQITKNKFLSEIHKKYKSIKYYMELNEIKDLYHNVLNDMFYHFISSNKYEYENITILLNEISNFVMYINTQIDILSKYYNKKTYYYNYITANMYY